MIISTEKKVYTYICRSVKYIIEMKFEVNGTDLNIILGGYSFDQRYIQYLLRWSCLHFLVILHESHKKFFFLWLKTILQIKILNW